MTEHSCQIHHLDELALIAVAQRLASAIAEGATIYLQGELGAGKTTFVRALLRAMGVGERIKSPTYSLIESYVVHRRSIHHLDLYRIADPEELEWLGLQDLLNEQALILIEWPERGGDRLPAADLLIQLTHAGIHRDLRVLGYTPRGNGWIEQADFRHRHPIILHIDN